MSGAFNFAWSLLKALPEQQGTNDQHLPLKEWLQRNPDMTWRDHPMWQHPAVPADAANNFIISSAVKAAHRAGDVGRWRNYVM